MNYVSESFYLLGVASLDISARIHDEYTVIGGLVW